MNDFNIRITHRAEIGGKAVERSIDIECLAPPQLQAIANARPDNENLVEAEPFEMAEALAEISRELGCANTLDDMLHAIDALRATKPQAPAAALEWSDTLCNGERVNYAKAEAACAALGEGWRLPTRMDLESILDLTRHEPAIDTDRFPDTKSGAYWTSTPCAWASSCAWFVFFDDGSANYSNRDGYSAFVRAVRSVPAALSPAKENGRE